MGQQPKLGGQLGGPLGMLSPSATQYATATVDVLLVGGGGAAGHDSSNPRGRGGGAGGQVIELTLPVPIGSYPVTVGLGGDMYLQTIGGHTKFFGLSAAGGADGGPINSNPPINPLGCSFNGGGRGEPGVGFGTITSARGGFEGGALYNDGSTFGGGGGGGAGGAGGNATISDGGAPGPGKISSISGVPVEYGKGGKGGHTNGSAPAPTLPGEGGGGLAPSNVTWPPPAQTKGLAGIFVLRYLTGTQVWIGGTVTVVGPYTIHKFTADGTIARIS